MKRLGLLAVVATLALVGCGDSGGGSTGEQEKPDGYVSRSEYGKRWPLTVDHGVMRCESFGDESGEVIFTAPDGTEYALNGLATDYEDLEPIWRYDPALRKYGIRVSMVLTEDALKLC